MLSTKAVSGAVGVRRLQARPAINRSLPTSVAAPVWRPSSLAYVPPSRHCRTGYAVFQTNAAPEAAAELPATEEDDRIPVTVITGFLGSGKTTLLNHILSRDHGMRIAVVENDVGEIDIDSTLVATQEYLESGGEIITLNNGCLCCTVRDDLVAVLHDLHARKSEFDHIIIETTGLANPNPIIQSFYLDPKMPDMMLLDGVLTVVDAKHVSQHLDDDRAEGAVNEALEQIAYADRIVLNKTDLVSEPDLEQLEARIRGINKLAHIRRAQQSEVPLSYVMGMGGFDVDKVMESLEVARAEAEAMGGHSHDHAHDHDCEVEGCDKPHGHAGAHEHTHDHDCEVEGCDKPHGHAGAHEHTHEHAHDHTHDHTHDHGPKQHADQVTSVSLEIKGDLDLNKVNLWLDALIELRFNDLYRMKGVLAIRGESRRHVFQGVHMLFEGKPDRTWREDEERVSRIVFIGWELEEDLLREGFEACRAEVAVAAA